MGVRSHRTPSLGYLWGKGAAERRREYQKPRSQSDTYSKHALITATIYFLYPYKKTTVDRGICLQLLSTMRPRAREILGFWRRSRSAHSPYRLKTSAMSFTTTMPTSDSFRPVSLGNRSCYVRGSIIIAWSLELWLLWAFFTSTSRERVMTTGGSRRHPEVRTVGESKGQHVMGWYVFGTLCLCANFVKASPKKDMVIPLRHILGVGQTFLYNNKFGKELFERIDVW